jgi:hypothetical protein
MPSSRSIVAVSASLLSVVAVGIPPSHAFTVNIAASNPRTLFLQVGVGSFAAGNFASGGNPGNNRTVNVVTVTVAPEQVGTGRSQVMTTDSTAARSFYDGSVACSLPGQLYIGGFYRSISGVGVATVRATSPANLVSTSGHRIPFTEISWTSSRQGESGAQPFPSGAFIGGVQTIGTILRNQWAESCHTFIYRNTVVVPAGTYSGRVTYTLSLL